jgi:hypothetical protein
MKITSELTERIYQKVRWQDVDIAMINNKRVLHGRRAIMGNVIDRELLSVWALAFFIFYESVFYGFYKCINLSMITLLASGKVNWLRSLISTH